MFASWPNWLYAFNVFLLFAPASFPNPSTVGLWYITSIHVALFSSFVNAHPPNVYPVLVGSATFTVVPYFWVYVLFDVDPAYVPPFGLTVNVCETFVHNAYNVTVAPCVELKFVTL